MLARCNTQNSFHTNLALIPLLELPHRRLDLLADHDDRLLSSHSRVLAMLIVYITQRDIGGVVLQKSEIGRA